jgi:hypothetical protein
MNVMIRIPRVCLVLVVTALLALLVVPVAGARTLSSPPAHPADGGWSGAVQHWVSALFGPSHPNHHRRSGAKVPNTKEATGGSCIDPVGKPFCL